MGDDVADGFLMVSLDISILPHENDPAETDLRRKMQKKPTVKGGHLAPRASSVSTLHPKSESAKRVRIVFFVTAGRPLSSTAKPFEIYVLAEQKKNAGALSQIAHGVDGMSVARRAAERGKLSRRNCVGVGKRDDVAQASDMLPTCVWLSA
jgi:hypothetical protein